MENKKRKKSPYSVLSYEELNRVAIHLKKKLNVAIKLIEYDELLIKNYEFLIKDIYKNKKL